ncbi:MAG: tetratricopeptide repeat protein [Anaerolineae bacterium]|nr:tetratricopeptide repeat protein [Anaerolineae bacterium]
MLFTKRYELYEQLGKGGMGAVYRAFDRLSGTFVALKHVVNEAMPSLENAQTNTENLDIRMTLTREFKTLASLRHPHIINVLDYGFNEKREPYFTMELLQGAHDFLSAEVETIEEKIQLAIQLLQALAYLHRRGVVHRDLKPANALVIQHDQLKLLDFGLASEQGAQEIPAGTLPYMAPELLLGGSPSVSSDLFAVGVMIYELLTGRHPFEKEHSWQTMNAIINESPNLDLIDQVITQQITLKSPTSASDQAKTTVIQLPDVPPSQMVTQEAPIIGTSLADILARLLTKLPEYRYETADEVIERLCRSLGLPLPSESPAIRESYLEAAKFIGRESQLARLLDALEATRKQQGSTWLIAGETGVGKSRLIEELRVRAMIAGIMVIRGHGRADGGAPYQLWREPLRQLMLLNDPDDLDAAVLKDLVPDITTLLKRPIPDPVPLEGDAYKQRLYSTVANLLNKQSDPLLLILEDLHWVSESLDLLKQVNKLINTLPVMIVGTYRTEERLKLAEELPEMSLIKLERLTTDETVALVRSILGIERGDITDYLQRESAGNLFFMVEILRALAQEAGRLDQIATMTLPQSLIVGGLQGVINGRIGRVPQQTLLRLAALYGREQHLGFLERVADTTLINDWLITCANYAVLELDTQNGRWQFVNDQLRAAVISLIPAEELPALHRQVAEAIEKMVAEGVLNAEAVASDLANHWHLTNDRDKAYRYARAAGDYTLKTCVFNEAILFYQRALTLNPTGDPKVQVKLGEALYYSGDYTGAAEQLEAALKSERTPHALNVLADVRWRSGAYDSASEVCQECIELAKSHNDPVNLARAFNRFGMVKVEQGEYAEAGTHLRESLEIARRLNAPDLAVGPVNNLSLIAFAESDYAAAQKYLEEALTFSRLTGERHKSAVILGNLGGIAGSQDDFESATRYFQESLSIAQAIGHRFGVMSALGNLGTLAEIQGKFLEAQTYQAKALEIAQLTGDRAWSTTILVSLAETMRNLEDRSQALTYAQQALQIAGEIDSLPQIMDILVILAKLTPDPLQAIQWLGLVLHHPATIGDTQRLAEPLIADYKQTLTATLVDQLIEMGKKRNLEEVIAEIAQIKSF